MTEFERGKALLDDRTSWLEPCRNSELFSQRFDRFVESESGRISRQFEEHSAGFAEVDRMKVSAIHDWSYIDVLADLLAPD